MTVFGLPDFLLLCFLRCSSQALPFDFCALFLPMCVLAQFFANNHALFSPGVVVAFLLCSLVSFVKF